MIENSDVTLEKHLSSHVKISDFKHTEEISVDVKDVNNLHFEVHQHFGVQTVYQILRHVTIFEKFAICSIWEGCSSLKPYDNSSYKKIEFVPFY